MFDFHHCTVLGSLASFSEEKTPSESRTTMRDFANFSLWSEYLKQIQ